MKRKLLYLLRNGAVLALLACPGWASALGLPFGSPSLAVEAKGMGNAVVADGTLFNATAYNPALLESKSDFAEVHLELNLGNDIFGMADYAFNFNNINLNNFDFNDILSQNTRNLKDSINDIGPSFNQVGSGLTIIGNGNPNGYLTYNQGVAGLQNDVNNIQTALSKFSNKSLQVGAGLQLAFKIDDNWGFQAYNTSQVAFQVGRGSLLKALLAIQALPTMSNGTSAQAKQAIVSLFHQTQPVIEAPLTPAQQQQLTTAEANLEASPGNTSDIQAFGNVVNNILGNLSSDLSKQALFNDIAPITALVYSDTVLMGTYCMRPLESDGNLTAGANLKAVNRRIASINSPFLVAQNTNDSSDINDDLKNDIQKSTWRWGVDLGVLYNFDDPKVAVGASATDLIHSTATLNTSPSDPLYGLVTDSAPTVVRVGASYKPTRELTVNADIDDLLGNTSYYQGLDAFSHVDFGFNYDLLGILQLRGGITNDNLCGGLGLPLGIQYAFAVDNLTQSYNHYLQFDVAF